MFWGHEHAKSPEDDFFLEDEKDGDQKNTDKGIAPGITPALLSLTIGDKLIHTILFIFWQICLVILKGNSTAPNSLGDPERAFDIGIFRVLFPALQPENITYISFCFRNSFIE